MIGNSITRFGLLGAALLITACAEDAGTVLGPEDGPDLHYFRARHSSAIVNWHAQQAPLGRTGQVEGARAKLLRTRHGLRFRIRSRMLTPHNAYTLWLVVIDNPEACSATPCTAADIILNEETDSQVRFAAGRVAGRFGWGTFAGSVRLGPLSGWLPDRSFDNLKGAEVHLVINDHGPKLPEYMPGMIRTYRGGCSDDSPFPPVFPATALADGEVGPNICRLYQVAVFTAP